MKLLIERAISLPKEKNNISISINFNFLTNRSRIKRS